MQGRALVCLRWLIGVLALLGLVGCSPRGGPPTELRLSTWIADLPERNEPLEVTLPAHFDDRLPRRPVSYELKTTVALPDAMRGKPLTLVVAHMPALATLTANGVEAMTIDAELLDRYRTTGPHRWRIPPDATSTGQLLLHMRVQHNMSRSAWIDSAPVLTTDPSGGRWVVGVYTFNTVAATGALAAALVIAVLYGFLFFTLRSQRRYAHGWFVIGATAGAAYPAFLLGLTQPVFGVYEAPFMLVSLVLGTLAAMHFARAYIDAPPPSRAWWIVFGLVVVIAVVARNPFYSVLVVAPLVVGVTVATAFAQLLFIARLRANGEKPAPVLYGVAFAWPGAVLLGMPDVLAWLGQGEPAGGIRTACVGVAGIAIYQAGALSREHLLALQHADVLVQQLEARVKAQAEKQHEVELLNDELRRQIANRSRELAEKLIGERNIENVEPPNLAAGDLVENRYRVITPIGSGGMGAVYEVERTTDHRHFALKALSAGGDPQQRARFAREAQVVASVNHPNVVSIVDVDVAKTGWIFLVMELVSGGTTLHDVRRRNRDVPWTLGVLAQVAEGLDAVHAAGIIHRDLKPGNILLARGDDGRKPEVKITDFGISSLQPADRASSARIRLEEADALPAAGETSSVPPLVDLEYDPEKTSVEGKGGSESKTEPLSKPKPAPSSKNPPARTPSAPLTETGLIFGTPQYMAQELTAGTSHATRASDVFSLGIIAFELLTGKRPFVEAPVSAILEGRPLPPIPDYKRYCPQLPPEIAIILTRAMSHEPRERPSAKELAAALRDSQKIGRSEDI